VSNWERLILGSRASRLGNSRWLVAGVLAMTGAVVSALGGLWLQALLFFGAAVAIAVLTVRRGL
jgi:hypothetical protein